MFLGEFVCFGLLGIKRIIYGDPNKQGSGMPLSPGGARAVEKKKLSNINPFLLAIPASCDFTASTLMFISLTMVPAAVY